MLLESTCTLEEECEDEGIVMHEVERGEGAIDFFGESATSLKSIVELPIVSLQRKASFLLFLFFSHGEIRQP